VGLLVGDTPFVVSSVNGFSCRRRGFGGDQEEGSLKHYNKEAKNADKLVEYKNAAILFCTKTR
jgi:hypothetical protein